MTLCYRQMIVSKQLNNLEDDLPFVLGVLREWSLFNVIFTLTISCWVVVQVTMNQKELFDLFRRSKDLYSNPLCYCTSQWMNLRWLRLRSEFKSQFRVIFLWWRIRQYVYISEINKFKNYMSLISITCFILNMYMYAKFVTER